MKIYVSTACLPGTEPLVDRIRRYADAGLTAVELGAGVRVAGALPAGDFLIHNYFPPPAESFVLNLASADDRVYSQSMALARQALTLTKRLGAPFYSIHAGFITDPVGFNGTSFDFPMPQSPAETEAAWQRFRRAVSELLAEAAALGVALLIENNVCDEALRGKLLLQTPDEFRRLVGAMDAPHLGILLDTGHLNVSARTFGFDRLDFVRELETHIRAFHLHDNDGVSDQHLPAWRESWAVQALRRPAFRQLPVVVEARFPTPVDLAEYTHQLGEWLTDEDDGGD